MHKRFKPLDIVLVNTHDGIAVGVIERSATVETIEGESLSYLIFLRGEGDSPITSRIIEKRDEAVIQFDTWDNLVAANSPAMKWAKGLVEFYRRSIEERQTKAALAAIADEKAIETDQEIEKAIAKAANQIRQETTSAAA